MSAPEGVPHDGPLDRVAAAGAALLVACAHQAPEKQPPAVSVPVPLIRKVCEQVHLEEGSGGHWDGRAQLLWSTSGAVVAVDCTFTVFVDGLTTVSVHVSLSDPRAEGLRDFLASRGAQ